MTEPQTEQQIAAQQLAPFLQQQQNQMGNMLYLTDPDSILERMERRLRGQEVIEGQIKSTGRRLMNDRGVNEVMGNVGSVVSRDSYVTNLDEEHVIALIYNLRDVLIEQLMQNRYNYKIDTDTDRTSIVFICLSMSFTALRRGYKEGDRRFFKGSSMEFYQGYQQPMGGAPGGGGQKRMGGIANPLNWWK